MASEGRKFDEKKNFSNDPRMCSEALGVALSVAKHLGTVLTSLDSIWDNLKKIEKMKFFQLFEAVFLYFYMDLSGFWAVPKFKIDFFSKKSF